MYERRELLSERDGETTRLLCPGVGEFTCAVAPGGMLGPGQDAGVLIVTGRSFFLRVPDGVSGRVQNPLPGRIHQPVGYRSVLYELAPISAEGALESAAAEEEAGSGLALRDVGRQHEQTTVWEPQEIGDPADANAVRRVGPEPQTTEARELPLREAALGQELAGPAQLPQERATLRSEG